MEITTIQNAQAQQLAKLLDPAAESLTIYHGANPAVILRHQLNAPLGEELRLSIAGAQTPPMEIDPAFRTFDDLFQHAQPPIELLKRAKDFAKACRANPQLLPPAVATVLYYAAITAARVRLQITITQLSDVELRTGLQWAISQMWVDEKTRKLFQGGLEKLG